MSVLDDHFWTMPNPRQTVTLAELQIIMQEHHGKMIVAGQLRELGQKKLCPDVYEVFLAPLKAK